MNAGRARAITTTTVHAFLPRSGLENGLSTFAAFILTLAVVASTPSCVAAQERSLNQGHPVRLDDAYPIAPGDATLLFGGRSRLQEEGSNGPPSGRVR